MTKILIYGQFNMCDNHDPDALWNNENSAVVGL